VSERALLRDGREMSVRQAAGADAWAVTEEHPLPRDGDASERLYQNYYLVKTMLYTRAPMAGISTAWVDGSLAGFVFHCRDMNRFRGFARSLRTCMWLASEVLRGRFGYSPSFWAGALRWGFQHFRQPRDYSERGVGSEKALPTVEAWIGTVHTVEAFRRLGVATALLGAVEDDLRAAGAPEVALWVASDNDPARQLYLKRGYEEHGTYSRISEDCLLMVKPLSPEAPEAAASTDAIQAAPGKSRVTPDSRPPGKGRAVVTDAGERVGLHIIRALGRAGVDVVATEVQERAGICPGFSSRYARETHVLPGCGEAGAAYADRLLEVGRDGDVLVPVCLNSLLSVIENRDLLSTKFRMLLPSLDALLRANDKWKLHGAAVEM